MAITSKASQTLGRWVLYLGSFFVVLILLFAIFDKEPQNNPENIQNTRSPEQPAGAIHTPAPIAAENQNTTDTASTYSAPKPVVSGQADPLRTFLDTHKNARLDPANAQPVLHDPKAIQDRFKEALGKQHAASIANPFSTAREPNNR